MRVGGWTEAGHPLEPGEDRGIVGNRDASRKVSDCGVAVNDDTFEDATPDGNANSGSGLEAAAGDEADAAGADIGDRDAEGQTRFAAFEEFEGAVQVQREAIVPSPVPGHRSAIVRLRTTQARRIA